MLMRIHDANSAPYYARHIVEGGRVRDLGNHPHHWPRTTVKMERHSTFMALFILHQVHGACDCIIPDYLCNVTPMLLYLESFGYVIEGTVIEVVEEAIVVR